MKANRGFSLIDVMAAVAVGGIMIMLLFRSVVQTGRVVTGIESTVDSFSDVALFKNRFEKDVLGMFVPQSVSVDLLASIASSTETTPDKKTETGTANQAESSKPRAEKTKDKSTSEESDTELDTIYMVKRGQRRNVGSFSFITTNVLTVYDDVKPRVARVFYELESKPDAVNRWQLKRYESGILDFNAFMSAKREGTVRGYVILDNIQKLTLHSWIPQQQVSQEESKEKKTVEYHQLAMWSDETVKEHKQLLPHFIELEGTIVDPRKKRSVSFQSFVPIQAQQFVLRYQVPLSVLKQGPGKQKMDDFARKGHAKNPQQRGVTPGRSA